jgi:hypothetical protein
MSALPSSDTQQHDQVVFSGEYASQLRALDAMGFKSRDLNTALLQQHHGNLQQTVSALVELMQA